MASVLKIKNALQSAVSSFLHKIFIDQKLNNFVGYILLSFFAVGLGYLFAIRTTMGIGIAAFIFSAAVVIVSITNTQIGLYITVIYSFFAYAFSRYFFNDEFLTGVPFDVLILVTLFSFFVKKISLKNTVNQFVHTSVAIATLALYFFLLVELFNPYTHSFDGWYQTFRKSLDSLFLLFIAYTAFDNPKNIRNFFILLFIVCTICAIYGCIQQWHGLFNYEIAWVTADENRFGLIFIGGDFRKFSTMPDPTAYGIIMASCGILFTIIAWNQKKPLIKCVIFTGVIFMFLGMAYSGTRTANAMAVAGLAMFMLLSINKKSTKIFAVVSGLIFIILMYGPFYGNATINRFRTTFTGTNDESYKVREINRAFIQPYIYSHPIGGGLCTTGAGGLRFNPSHYLAGFPPDSGYLKKALETGWIGLILICFLYFAILRNSIIGYFEADDPEIKIIYAACCAFFFSFYIADFAQDAIGQITDTVVYYPLIAISLRLRDTGTKEKMQKNVKEKSESPNILYS